MVRYHVMQRRGLVSHHAGEAACTLAQIRHVLALSEQSLSQWSPRPDRQAGVLVIYHQEVSTMLDYNGTIRLWCGKWHQDGATILVKMQDATYQRHVTARLQSLGLLW